MADLSSNGELQIASGLTSRRFLEWSLSQIRGSVQKAWLDFLNGTMNGAVEDPNVTSTVMDLCRLESDKLEGSNDEGVAAGSKHSVFVSLDILYLMIMDFDCGPLDSTSEFHNALYLLATTTLNNLETIIDLEMLSAPLSSEKQFEELDEMRLTESDTVKWLDSLISCFLPLVNALQKTVEQAEITETEITKKVSSARTSHVIRFTMRFISVMTALAKRYPNQKKLFLLFAKGGVTENCVVAIDTLLLFDRLREQKQKQQPQQQQKVTVKAGYGTIGACIIESICALLELGLLQARDVEELTSAASQVNSGISETKEGKEGQKGGKFTLSFYHNFYASVARASNAPLERSLGYYNVLYSADPTFIVGLSKLFQQFVFSSLRVALADKLDRSEATDSALATGLWTQGGDKEAMERESEQRKILDHLQRQETGRLLPYVSSAALTRKHISRLLQVCFAFTVKITADVDEKGTPFASMENGLQVALNKAFLRNKVLEQLSAALEGSIPNHETLAPHVCRFSKMCSESVDRLMTLCGQSSTNTSAVTDTGTGAVGSAKKAKRTRKRSESEVSQSSHTSSTSVDLSKGRIMALAALELGCLHRLSALDHRFLLQSESEAESESEDKGKKKSKGKGVQEQKGDMEVEEASKDKDVDADSDADSQNQNSLLFRIYRSIFLFQMTQGESESCEDVEKDGEDDAGALRQAQEDMMLLILKLHFDLSRLDTFAGDMCKLALARNESGEPAFNENNRKALARILGQKPMQALLLHCFSQVPAVQRDSVWRTIAASFNTNTTGRDYNLDNLESPDVAHLQLVSLLVRPLVSAHTQSLASKRGPGNFIAPPAEPIHSLLTHATTAALKGGKAAEEAYLLFTALLRISSAAVAQLPTDALKEADNCDTEEEKDKDKEKEKEKEKEKRPWVDLIRLVFDRVSDVNGLRQPLTRADVSITPREQYYALAALLACASFTGIARARADDACLSLHRDNTDLDTPLIEAVTAVFEKTVGCDETNETEKAAMSRMVSLLQQHTNVWGHLSESIRTKAGKGQGQESTVAALFVHNQVDVDAEAATNMDSGSLEDEMFVQNVVAAAKTDVAVLLSLLKGMKDMSGAATKGKGTPDKRKKMAGKSQKPSSSSFSALDAAGRKLSSALRWAPEAWAILCDREGPAGVADVLATAAALLRELRQDMTGTGTGQMESVRTLVVLVETCAVALVSFVQAPNGGSTESAWVQELMQHCEIFFATQSGSQPPPPACSDLVFAACVDEDGDSERQLESQSAVLELTCLLVDKHITRVFSSTSMEEENGDSDIDSPLACIFVALAQCVDDSHSSSTKAHCIYRAVCNALTAPSWRSAVCATHEHYVLAQVDAMLAPLTQAADTKTSNKAKIANKADKGKTLDCNWQDQPHRLLIAAEGLRVQTKILQAKQASITKGTKTQSQRPTSKSGEDGEGEEDDEDEGEEEEKKDGAEEVDAGTDLGPMLLGAQAEISETETCTAWLYLSGVFLHSQRVLGFVMEPRAAKSWATKIGQVIKTSMRSMSTYSVSAEDISLVLTGLLRACTQQATVVACAELGKMAQTSPPLLCVRVCTALLEARGLVDRASVLSVPLRMVQELLLRSAAQLQLLLNLPFQSQQCGATAGAETVMVFQELVRAMHLLLTVDTKTKAGGAGGKKRAQEDTGNASNVDASVRLEERGVDVAALVACCVSTTSLMASHLLNVHETGTGRGSENGIGRAVIAQQHVPVLCTHVCTALEQVLVCTPHECVSTSIGTLCAAITDVAHVALHAPSNAQLGGGLHIYADPMGALRKVLVACAQSRDFAKHGQFLVAALCDLLGNSGKQANKNKERMEALQPGIFALLEKCGGKREALQMVAPLDERGRAVLAELQKKYDREYKFRGRV